MQKLTKEVLEKYKENQVGEEKKDIIRVGMSTCGIAAGAEEVFEVLKTEAKQKNLKIEIQKCGCNGKCYAEPSVEVEVKGLPTVVYGKVNKNFAISIIDRHIINGELLNDHIYYISERNGEDK